MYRQNVKTSHRHPTPVRANFGKNIQSRPWQNIQSRPWQFWQKYSIKTLAKIFNQDLGHNLTQIHQSLVDFGKTDIWQDDAGSVEVEPRSPAVWNGRSPCRGAQLLLACSSALVHFSTRNANLIPGFHYTRAHPLYSPSINFNSNLYRATLQVILELNYAFWGCSLWSCADILQFNIIQILEFRF